jgi:hypothetical protein
MRESKIRTAEANETPGWSNKLFMNRISSALLEKVFSGEVPLRKLAEFAVLVLDERHLILQLDNEKMSGFLSQHGWDGDIRPDHGDFLMVVDSNIGFNKTNAVVDTQIAYNIDLSNPAVPVAQVIVNHTNFASHLVPCALHDRVTLEGQKDYPIDRCYWGYLRIYTREQSGLLQANPQSIPAEWMLRGQEVPAHVDILDEELDDVSAFGLLKVVPGKQTVTTKLHYTLPVEILSIRPGTRQVVYHLTVKKQPGTIAIPINIEVLLPENVTVISLPDGTELTDNSVIYQGDLRTDLEFELVFEIP